MHTIYLVAHEFLGSTKGPIEVLRPYLSSQGWLVGVDIDPKGGYCDSKMAEAIEVENQ